MNSLMSSIDDFGISDSPSRRFLPQEADFGGQGSPLSGRISPPPWCMLVQVPPRTPREPHPNERREENPFRRELFKALLSESKDQLALKAQKKKKKGGRRGGSVPNEGLERSIEGGDSRPPSGILKRKVLRNVKISQLPPAPPLAKEEAQKGPSFLPSSLWRLKEVDKESLDAEEGQSPQNWRLCQSKKPFAEAEAYNSGGRISRLLAPPTGTALKTPFYGLGSNGGEADDWTNGGGLFTWPPNRGDELAPHTSDSSSDKRGDFPEEAAENQMSVLSGDWCPLGQELNVCAPLTSTPKSVYFDLGGAGVGYPSCDEDEDPKLVTERHLSICDSGIGVDDDFRSASRGSFQILSDDEDFADPEEGSGTLSKLPEEREAEVLCGSRVSQMTQTYHDIEAVTRLLQEKEKDLELAARIGQQLLARNKALEEKNSSLENDIGQSSEKITQLKHDLQMKADLLHLYTNDFDESSADTTPTGMRHINVDILQARVKNLENENVSLRQEASQLACDTQDCEEKENELVHDVIKQLNDANLQVHQLSEELSRKIEESLRQQDDTTQLLAQLVELQATSKRLMRENEELASLVTVARECQEELTTELAELKEKYAEVLDLLHDTQEQLRRVQKKNYPSSRGSHLGSGLFSSTLSGHDSIASELHGLGSGGEELEKADGAKSLSRVFDTVRLSSKLGSSMPALGYSGGSVYSTPTKQANLSHTSTPLHSSMGVGHSPYFGNMTMSSHSSMASSGLHSLDSGADSDHSFHTDSEENYPASCNGVPGWPGTPDLDSCIRRLGPNMASSYLPYGCRTPDSIMSTGSGRSGLSGYSGGEWKLPQKLQIVKPIEGSLTLHQWSRLATPHLGGLLEEREGVAIKGALNADLNLELYSMSDYEEDDEEGGDYPGKQFQSTSGIYTFTNSTVLHPDDITSLTPSLRATHSSVLQTSLASRVGFGGSQPSSQPASRRGSTATFSTNVGLAKHLQERGVTRGDSDEAMNPTATPANSPNRSRPGSPELYESYKLPGFDDLTRSLHAGASFLKRTLYGRGPIAPSSPPHRGHRVNIVERVQALGVDRFVRQGGAPLSVGGVVTTRAQPPSPLLHLSNLIRSGKEQRDLPSGANAVSTGDATPSVAPGGIMSTPRITSPGERRPKLPLGAPMGIPGQPGSGQLDSRLTQLKPGQRSDLGTVGGFVGSRPRPSGLGSVPGRGDTKMGTVGWTSMGRKGGLL